MPNQDVAFELFYDNAWHDIVTDDDVFTAQPIVIQRGQGSASPAPRPALITAQLNNDHDKHRTSNPMSPLYRKAGRGTPARVSVAGSARGLVESASWVCDQTQDFRRSPKRGRAWTDFQGGGLLQRFNEWTVNLRSPFHRVNSAFDSLVGYWSGERQPSEANLIAEVTGSSTGTIRHVTAPSNDHPEGSEPLVKIGSEGFMEGFFATTGEDASGYQLSWAMRLPVQPDGGTAIAPMEWELADGSTGSLQWVGTDLWLFTFGPGGASQFNIVVSGSDTDWTLWNVLTLKVSVSGGTVTGEFDWHTEGSESFSAVSDTYASTTTSELSRWFVGVALGGENSGTAYGHIMGTIGTSAVLDSVERISAFRGWRGERTAYRFARLMDEFNLPYYVSNGFDNSWPMGPQGVDTLGNQITEIVATEDGLLFDFRTEARLYFLLRVDRYNQTPALELFPEDLPSLPREATNSSPVHNIVTISQRNGGEVTATDDTGPLGTQPPPDGAGEQRQTIDVNVSDEADLPQLANWWLRRGTVNLPSFPQVTVNLAALDAAKVAEVEAVDVGSVITISGFREYTIRLHVIGYTETIGWPRARKIVFNCALDQQFDVAIQDDTSKRQDSYTSTLTTDYSPSATSIVVGFTVLADQWSQVSTPYDWGVAGERITVTSMGAVTGSGPWTQTASVKRSANEIVKPQISGEPVHMFPEQQARQAL